jgi:N-formylglutamate amidohydrolase
MNEFVSINLDGTTPLLATAIHDGHLVSEDLASLFALKESAQLREEDPFTALWTDITGNKIIARHSRFEFDLNRPPEKAVYILPSDAWGLEVWRTKPSASIITRSQQRYAEIYQNFHEAITELVSRYNGLVVFDLHSYNHRRNGPNAPPEDKTMNPEINLGTGNMDRIFWGSLVDRFITDLKGYDFSGRQLDVRENIKFKGGYFSKWIHKNFKESVCCLSIEVKKFFMDEWTGEPDHSIINAIGEALKATVPGVIEELSIRRANSNTD